MKNNEFFSIEEVSKKLKVVYLTVYRWVRSKKLKSYKAGRLYRIKSGDLENFIKINK